MVYALYFSKFQDPWRICQLDLHVDASGILVDLERLYHPLSNHIGPGVQVDYDGAYPIEGAKEVSVLLTRYASRALRQWQHAQKPASSQLMTFAALPSFVPKSIRGTPQAKQFLQLVLRPHHGIDLRKLQPPQ